MVTFKLRKWRVSDLDSLVKYANNPKIAKFLTNQFPFPYTRKDGKRFLKSVVKEDPPKILAIEVDHEAVGAIGVFPQSDIYAKNAEMGYWLAEPYWGRGIMARAIKEMVSYGFQTFDVTRIFARPFSTNSASQRVLEKAGFVLEAKLEKSIFKQGEYLDELIYSIRNVSSQAHAGLLPETIRR